MSSIFSQSCIICSQTGNILCYGCQRHLNGYQSTQDDDINHLTGVIVGRHYDRIIKHLVHRLKYGRGRSVATFLGSKLATLISTTNLMDQIQLYPGQVVITAVPTHWIKRYFSRGYNQAELLAKSIASSLNLPYQDLLYKSRRTTSQVKVRNRSQRLTNVLNSFTHTHARSTQQKNLHQNPNNSSFPSFSQSSLVVIVDDLITTGATMSECARIIHDQYPHSQIWGVCIARNR